MQESFSTIIELHFPYLLKSFSLHLAVKEKDFMTAATGTLDTVRYMCQSAGIYSMHERIYKLLNSKDHMLYAYILLTVRIGMLNQALEEVRKLDEVIEADAITGPYDMVVYLAVDGLTQLTKTLLHQIETIQGVTESMTLVVVDV